MDDYLAFAQDLARQGGQVIKDNFQKNLAVELKPDNTPVTEVDKTINELISQAIQSRFPEHGLLGEEADHGSGDEAWQWLCDPLDGTRSFIIGVPVSTCILGLMHGGAMQLAVVYNPFEDMLYHAMRGQGAFCNGKPIRVNKQTLAEGGFVCLSDSAVKYFDALTESGAQVEPLPGAGYRAVHIAAGRCSGVLQTPQHTDFHDVGVAALIVEEAGGKATDLAGQPLPAGQQFKNGIILSNGLVHDALIAIAQQTSK